MEHSLTSSSDALFKAMIKVQAEIVNPGRNAVNPFFKSRYATLDSMLAQIRPLLARHGLVLSQFVNNGELVTLLGHESGQYLSGSAPVVADKKGPQGYGSALSYQRRYQLESLLAIFSDVDDDGNSAESIKSDNTVSDDDLEF